MQSLAHLHTSHCLGNNTTLVSVAMSGLVIGRIFVAAQFKQEVTLFHYCEVVTVVPPQVFVSLFYMLSCTCVFKK